MRIADSLCACSHGLRLSAGSRPVRGRSRAAEPITGIRSITWRQSSLRSSAALAASTRSAGCSRTACATGGRPCWACPWWWPGSRSPGRASPGRSRRMSPRDSPAERLAGHRAVRRGRGRRRRGPGPARSRIVGVTVGDCSGLMCVGACLLFSSGLQDTAGRPARHSPAGSLYNTFGSKRTLRRGRPRSATHSGVRCAERAHPFDFGNHRFHLPGYCHSLPVASRLHGRFTEIH